MTAPGGSKGWTLVGTSKWWPLALGPPPEIPGVRWEAFPREGFAGLPYDQQPMTPGTSAEGAGTARA